MARVRRLLERAVRAGTAPGMVAGWMRSDDTEPRCVVVGHAAVRPIAEEVAEGHWFDLASLTKVLVITPLVLIAFRNQDVSLETRIAQTLPELGGTQLGARRIRHLVTHTSGLPAWAPIYAHDGGPDSSGVLRALSRLPVGEVRGEVVYSCPGFILLGLILERIAGLPLNVLFDRLVLEPLGLTNEIRFCPGLERPIAAGARIPGAERSLMIERGLNPECIPAISPGLPDDGNARFLGGVAGNAGLFGTIRGVLGLGRAMNNPDDLLDGDEIALAIRNHTPGLAQARGIGWQLASSPECSAGTALSPRAYGHTGFTGTSLWIDPLRGLSMALLTNRVHPGHRSTDLHPLRRRFHQLVVAACT
jgi:CubicO group peptidase (beta-lactamase class C family)